MPYIEVTATELMHAVEQLPPEELERFVAQVMALHAQRQTAHLSTAETDLLGRINTPVPDATLRRYRHLIALRQQERLTAGEHEELIALGDAIEQAHAQRMQWLAELAALRNTTLSQVMDAFGIKPLPYA